MSEPPVPRSEVLETAYGWEMREPAPYFSPLAMSFRAWWQRCPHGGAPLLDEDLGRRSDSHCFYDFLLTFVDERRAPVLHRYFGGHPELPEKMPVPDAASLLTELQTIEEVAWLGTIVCLVDPQTGQELGHRNIYQDFNEFLDGVRCCGDACSLVDRDGVPSLRCATGVTTSVFDIFAPDATTWQVTPPPVKKRYRGRTWQLTLTCQYTNARLSTDVEAWEYAALAALRAREPETEPEVRLRTATFDDYSYFLGSLRNVCRTAVEADAPAWFYDC